MLSKKEISQKSIRFDSQQVQALDVLSTITSRSINELVSEGVEKLIVENLMWLSDGYLQTMEPTLYEEIVKWVSSYINGTLPEGEKKAYFNPANNTFIERNGNGWFANAEYYTWNPVLSIPESTSTSISGLSMVFGIAKGTLCVWYTITIIDGTGAPRVVENNRMMLCQNLKFFDVTKDTFLNPVFGRYFWYFPYVRQNYVSLIWKGLGDK